MLFTKAFQLLAQTPRVNCAKATTQLEMNICEEQKYLKVDKELNGLYQKIMGVLKEKQMNEVKTQLIISQKKWIELRDSNAKTYEIIYKGGSSMAMNAMASKTLLTTQRIQDLKGLFQQLSL